MGKITIVPKSTPIRAYKITDDDVLKNLHSNLYKVNDEHEFIVKQGAPYVGGYIIWVAGMAPEYITQDQARKRFDLVKEGW